MALIDVLTIDVLCPGEQREGHFDVGGGGGIG